MLCPVNQNASATNYFCPWKEQTNVAMRQASLFCHHPPPSSILAFQSCTNKSQVNIKQLFTKIKFRPKRFALTYSGSDKIVAFIFMVCPSRLSLEPWFFFQSVKLILLMRWNLSPEPPPPHTGCGRPSFPSSQSISV